MSDVPRVTVLIPARDEEADIERCVRAVLAQDYPHERMEVVVVDGGSTDGTANVVQASMKCGDIDWKLVANAAGSTPSSLNAGLAVASGAFVCRVDARSLIPPEYVRLCVEVLSGRAEIVVTGGAQVAVARSTSSHARGIARALNNRYTMGGSRYRSGAGSGPADTVYLGAFRTEQLRVAGGWDDRLATNQDFDLNRRLGQEGIVWFDDRLRVSYVPRPTLRQLWSQYHRFGRWKVRYWRLTGDHAQPRQIVLLALAAGGLVGAVLVACSSRLRWTGLATGAAALASLEAVGTDEPSADPLAHAVGGAAVAVTGVAWVSGVAREALTWQGRHRWKSESRRERRHSLRTRQYDCARRGTVCGSGGG